MRNIFVFILSCSLLTHCVSVKTDTKIDVISQTPELKDLSLNSNPKLVVGIVVDQMRYDYITRFYNKFGQGGFKRLINEGYSFSNVHFNYIRTYTAVGHASVFTGTTPTNHGIISNYWYDKFEKKSIYCVDDSSYKPVGTGLGSGKSPYRMLTTTIADQLKLGQNMRGKTIGVSIKDRSAILPVGHTADAAYWFYGEDEGKFVTSTFYMDKLPKWVDDFNNSGIANEYLEKEWDTYYDINTYTESIVDDNDFEEPFEGKDSPSFPYDLSTLRKTNENFSILKRVAYGNDIVEDFAKATIIGEDLGKGNYTDFLAISFSSTDYIGHQFGVDSKEVEDTYIRLDKNIEDFINFLDSEVGKENYTLFLTADHAAVQVPSYLNSLKVPGGYFDKKKFKTFVNAVTKSRFNSEELVENISNYQIFLNKDKIAELNLDILKVEQIIADEIINFENVYMSTTAHTMQTTTFSNGVMSKLQKGYNQKFSGDILFVLNPNTVGYMLKGSTHGSGYSYDTHVPLIFYGKGIKHGFSNANYPITDIAPTIATFLNVEQPNGTTGKVITEVLD